MSERLRTSEEVRTAAMLALRQILTGLESGHIHPMEFTIEYDTMDVPRDGIWLSKEHTGFQTLTFRYHVEEAVRHE